jgi:outer membrane protein OmpA-like peptidoglycan-associated protein
VRRTLAPPPPPAGALWWKRHRATLVGSVMALAAAAVLSWVAVSVLRPILDDRSAQASGPTLGAQQTEPTPVTEATSRPNAADLPLIIQEKPRVRPTEQPGKSFDLKARFLFGTGSTELTDRARTRLHTVAGKIRAGKVKGIIQVNGYTDEVGRPRDNLILSSNRAKAVAEALQNELAGVPVKLAPQGFGERRPAATNDTAQGRASNRRVVIVLPERKPGGN